MPYRRRAPVRRRRRATPWYSKKYSAMQMAAKALRATRYIKGLVNSERMYYDRAITLGSIKSQNFTLTNLSQGDQVGQRTGNSILLRSIYFRGYIQINPSVTLNTRISIALVKDTMQVADTIVKLLIYSLLMNLKVSSVSDKLIIWQVALRFFGERTITSMQMSQPLLLINFGRYMTTFVTTALTLKIFNATVTMYAFSLRNLLTSQQSLLTLV